MITGSGEGVVGTEGCSEGRAGERCGGEGRMEVKIQVCIHMHTSSYTT